MGQPALRILRSALTQLVGQFRLSAKCLIGLVLGDPALLGEVRSYRWGLARSRR
jgi:hypothetical protein